jgi:hypothetical protein
MNFRLLLLQGKEVLPDIEDPTADPKKVHALDGTRTPVRAVKRRRRNRLSHRDRLNFRLFQDGILIIKAYP